MILETSSDSQAVSLKPIGDKAPKFVSATEVDNSPLYLEDISVGDHWFSPTREVTAEDVADFAFWKTGSSWVTGAKHVGGAKHRSTQRCNAGTCEYCRVAI
jgi:hypothetical protein